MSVIKNDDDFLFSIGIRENDAEANSLLNHSNFKKQVEEEKEPCKKDKSFVNANLAMFCHIRHTNYVGQIHGLNTNLSGRYPGSKYPVVVKMLNDVMADSLCSYSVAQIELLSKGEAEVILRKLNRENISLV